MTGQLDRPSGRSQPRDLDRVLDGHRKAVQRAEGPALGHRLVGGGRRPHGALGVEGDDRVEGRVDALDPVQECLAQIAAGELPPGDCGGEPAGGPGRFHQILLRVGTVGQG